jgi:hypothetical protein
MRRLGYRNVVVEKPTVVLGAHLFAHRGLDATVTPDRRPNPLCTEIGLTIGAALTELQPAQKSGLSARGTSVSFPA